MKREQLAALGLVLLAATGCGGGRDLRFPGAPVVLVSIDTLRSDRLPAYGFAGVETPAIDRLAEDGIVYERAWSHYPLTLPSHATLLTGALSPVHGVRDNVGYRLDPTAVPTLARRLRESGYRTGAAVSTYLLRSDTGLGDGFEVYDDAVGLKRGSSLAESQRSGRETVKRAIDFLDGAQDGPPFLFLHLYEPHTPYEPPEPFASRYPEPYLGEIAAADAVLGELLAALDRLGLYQRSLVVLVSDHGEGLGDHGEREHGILLYREALQVPLVVKLPGARRAGSRVAAPAGLADVAPTIAAAVASPLAGSPTTLFDLLGATPPARLFYAETFYPRIHLGWSDLASATDGSVHLVDGPDPELYDLASDPGERRNVLAERRRDYATLRAEVEARRTPFAAPAAVDAETAARLGALGYLSAPATAAAGPLPDPKANLDVLEDLFAAYRAQGREDWAAAVDGFTRVIAKNPGMVDAWENLAQCQQALGRPSAAESSFRRALELSGGADHVALGLARLYLELERWDDARRHAELALATNPAAAHRVLGGAALGAGDLAVAEKHARDALAGDPDDPTARVLLAEVENRLGRPEAALADVGAAKAELARRPGEEPPPGLFLVEGDALARLGRGDEAVAAFEAEIALHPRDPRAWARLSVLHAVEGRPEAAIGVLRRLVETQQSAAAYAAAVDTLRVLGDPRSAAGLLRQALARFPDDPGLRRLAGTPSPAA